MPISVAISRTAKSRIARIRAPRPGLTRPPFLDRRFEFPVEPLQRCFCWCERRHDAQMRKASTEMRPPGVRPTPGFNRPQFHWRGRSCNPIRGPLFRYPPGYAYRRWGIGAFLPSLGQHRANRDDIVAQGYGGNGFGCSFAVAVWREDGLRAYHESPFESRRLPNEPCHFAKSSAHSALRFS
jgi:hypothetical protein